MENQESAKNFTKAQKISQNFEYHSESTFSFFMVIHACVLFLFLHTFRHPKKHQSRISDWLLVFIHTVHIQSHSKIRKAEKISQKRKKFHKISNIFFTRNFNFLWLILRVLLFSLLQTFCHPKKLPEQKF